MRNTNRENFEAAKMDAIEKINALPDVITVTTNWEDVEMNVAAGKTEAVGAIRSLNTFIPAFSPTENIRSGILGCTGRRSVSENAFRVFDIATWEE
jgi:hypothetical protein